MSFSDWLQLLMTGCLMASVTYLFLNQVSLRRQIHEMADKSADESQENILSRLRKLEIDAKSTREELVASILKLDSKIKELAESMPKDPWDVKTANSSEANELRSLAESRDEIPSLRQIERTRQRLQSELHVDLRTLLRDQLA